MANPEEKATEQIKAYLNEDDFLEGSLDDANKKIKGIIDEEVKTAVEKALNEERAKNKPAPTGDDAPLTREQLDGIDPASLGVAVFSNEDEDIKETANTLLKSELAKLPDGATRKQVKEAAAKVDQRIAKMLGHKPADNGDDDPYKNGPVGVDTSGASEAHIKGAKPQTLEECEDLAAKLAASAAEKFGKKN
jgi:hypothetical protein